MPQLDLLAFTEELAFVFFIFVIYGFYFRVVMYPSLDLIFRVRRFKMNTAIKVKYDTQMYISLYLLIYNKYTKFSKFFIDFYKNDNK